MEEILRELLDQETKARDKYAELLGSVRTATARELLSTILNQKKFEIETLRLLASSKVPDRFLGFGTVVENDVNFRDAPSPQGNILKSLSRGTPVILTDRRGNWVGLQLYDGQSGWVFKDYVRAGN